MWNQIWLNAGFVKAVWLPASQLSSFSLRFPTYNIALTIGPQISLQNNIFTTPGTLILCREECKMVPPLWKTVWQFLKKLNIDLPYSPAILLLGIYPREMKTYVHTKTDVWMFIAALFMSEPQKHYSKWKKPDEKDHIYYESIYMRKGKPRKDKSTDFQQVRVA